MSTLSDPYNSANPDATIFTKLANDPRTKPWADLLRRLPDLVAKLEASSSSGQSGHLVRQLSETLPTIKHLAYRLISPCNVPTSVLTHFPNVPVLEAPASLNGQQVLRTRPLYLPHLGPTYSINFDSHILEADIIASNGTIHLIDSVPKAPDTVIKVLEDLPAASFSILHRAMEISDLFEDTIQGCTVFAPVNAAFADVGVYTADDLDRSADIESLKGLLRPQFCPNQTLYSNRYYDGKIPESTASREEEAAATALTGSEIAFRIGVRVFELETTLPGRGVVVEVNRYGGLIDMRVNGLARVLSADHIASNGVVHLIDHLL
ncbi:hypothetical protein LTR08_001567 [Meristemomyces frigidus]|nr:hypothetical protein LTR08_001567 [Meristemomyces frigidus]